MESKQKHIEEMNIYQWILENYAPLAILMMLQEKPDPLKRLFFYIGSDQELVSYLAKMYGRYYYFEKAKAEDEEKHGKKTSRNGRYICLHCNKEIVGNSGFTTDDRIYCSPCLTLLVDIALKALPQGKKKRGTP